MVKYVIDESYRLRMLMAGVYVGIGISSTYGFSIFTELLKSKYGFDQSQITTISTTGNCCGYLSFFAGALFDYAGPKVLLPIAGMLGFIGYLLFGLAFDDVIPKKESQNANMIQFCIFNAILYFGCPALDVGTLMPLMLNFPRERAYMVIIQKTFSGLGTSVLMAYFNGWFLNQEDKSKSLYSGYSYFVAVELLVVALVGAAFVDLPPYYMTIYRRRKLTKQARLAASEEYDLPAELKEAALLDLDGVEPTGDAQLRLSVPSAAQEELEERKAIAKVYLTTSTVKSRLVIACVLVGVMLVTLTVSSIVTAYVATTDAAYIGITVVVLVILCAFTVIAWPFQWLGGYPKIKKRHPKFFGLGIVEGDDDAIENDETQQNKEMKNGAVALEERNERDDASLDEKLKENNGDVLKEEVPGQVESDPKGIDRDQRSRTTDQQNSQPEKKEEEPKGKVLLQEPQYQGSFWRNLLTIDLWLLWLTFFGLWGTGTVINMNAAQLYRSINNGVYDARRQSLYVALIGVGSAVGRIVSGLIDMKLTNMRLAGKRDIPTTLFLPTGCVFLLLAYLFFAIIPAEGLILPFIIGSIGGGLGWGLGTLTIRICYARDVGKHYNFMFSSGFVSVIVLNRFMFGQMFDNEGRKEGTLPFCDKRICVRNQCFILMAINVMCFCTATAAHIRFNRFVRREKKKLHEELDFELSSTKTEQVEKQSN